jgi:hypothetical protein
MELKILQKKFFWAAILWTWQCRVKNVFCILAYFNPNSFKCLLNLAVSYLSILEVCRCFTHVDQNSLPTACMYASTLLLFLSSLVFTLYVIMFITVHDFKVELPRAYKQKLKYTPFLPPKCHNSLFHQRGIIMQVATCVRMPRNAGTVREIYRGRKISRNSAASA